MINLLLLLQVYEGCPKHRRQRFILKNPTSFFSTDAISNMCTFLEEIMTSLNAHSPILYANIKQCSGCAAQAKHFKIDFNICILISLKNNSEIEIAQNRNGKLDLVDPSTIDIHAFPFGCAVTDRI